MHFGHFQLLVEFQEKMIEDMKKSSKVAVFSFIPRICSMLEVIFICQMLKSSLDNESLPISHKQLHHSPKCCRVLVS